MKQYALIPCKNSEFKGLLVCLSSDNLYSYIKSINNEDLIKQSKGKLLVDQLLITGNEKNRFISFNYDYGQIDYNSTKYNTPQNNLKEISLSVFRKNIANLNNSILTENEKYCISKNIIF